MERKAQITLFILAGMLILALAGLFFYVQGLSSQKNPQVEQPTEIKTLQLFVEACLKETARDGLDYISSQGGYYEPPEMSLETGFAKLPFYYYMGNDTKLMPDLSMVQEELSIYIEDSLGQCLEDFEPFKKAGYSISAGEVLDAQVTIGEKSVHIKLNYPVTVDAGNFAGIGSGNGDSSSKVFDSFTADFGSDFASEYAIIRKASESQTKYPNSIAMSSITSLAYDNDFKYELTYLDEDTVIFDYLFNDTISDKELVFSYAVKYDWRNLENAGDPGSIRTFLQDPGEPIDVHESGRTSKESKIVIESIPALNITSDYDHLNFQVVAHYSSVDAAVSASTSEFTFQDNSQAFDIEPKTGMIELNGYNLTNGIERALITARDENGNQAFAFLVVNVDKPDLRPIMKEIAPQAATVGQEFRYIVNATDPTGNYLGFVDDTELFDIHPTTGEIRFIPTAKGNFTIKITAANLKGSTYQMMRLEVR